MRYVLIGSLLLLVGAQQERNASPQFNPYANTWEMTYPGAQPTWNPYANTWTLQQPGAQPQYNPYSGQWEFPH